MCFNLDISKQAHEFFSRNRSIAFHPPLTFNNIPVAQTNYQKYLGMHLDNTAQKMKFSIEDFFSKCGQIRRKQSFKDKDCAIPI